MNPHLQRALVFLAQQRTDLAEGELKKALADDPHNGWAHALLAECLIERDAYVEATEEAQQAILHAPDESDGYAALAGALLHRNRFAEARRAIDEAIRIEPGNAMLFARWAAIEYACRDWAQALAAAEEGLKIDPEQVTCTNLRAMALQQLGRRDEAIAALGDALALDPENPLSHANQGWGELHRGNPRKAKEHFAEALRLEPGLEYARRGLIEAMKARNPLYGLVLRYFLWMNRLSGQAQWAIILGGLIGQRFLRHLARENPALAPIIWPVLILYLIFVLMTWLAIPLFNLLLMLDRFGRHALNRVEKIEASLVGGFIGLAVIGLAAWGILSLVDSPFSFLGVLIAAYFGLLTLPISGIFKVPDGWPRLVMGGYALGLAILGLLVIPAGLVQSDSVTVLVTIFIWGCALAWLPINALSSVNVQR